ncbi:hypothetical protein GGR57DRAFT_234648 [Xylariaceae sp. FL1272]|nr:hypothetical protein GGR57DRAFT_234648 [Xylariaceae sp. FL1272]
MESDATASWRQHLYHQTRLKDKNSRIRLLTIQPRQYAASRPEAPSEAIHCFLRLAQLQDHPKFTVLSHRWQATDAIDESKAVLVNGASVPVSAGLFDVLSCVQNETEPVVVWIDSLCVNHADEDQREKSIHVSQLPQIYVAAEKTLIWLGPSADKSDDAMKVLRRLADEQLTLSSYVAAWTPQIGHHIAQKILPSKANDVNSQSSPSTEKEKPELEIEIESLREPLKALMKRDYWTNLWSLIELSLSYKAFIACGKQSLEIDQFYSAAKALDHIINHLTYSKWLKTHTNPAPTSLSSGALSPGEISNLARSPAVRILGRREDYRRDATAWLRSHENPLFKILSSFFAVKSSDQESLRIEDARDRVYALACLATDVADLGLAVDYSKRVDEVYAESSAALLQKHPRVLQLAQGTSSLHSNSNAIPSWAIDWEHVRQPPSDIGTSERRFDACGPADIRFYRADTNKPGQISLKTSVVDTIEAVGAQYEPSESVQTDGGLSFLLQIKQFWEDSTASITSPYFAEQAAVALAKIAVGDIEAGDGSNTFKRASSSTITGYKKTFDALAATKTAADASSVDADASQDDTQQSPEPKDSDAIVSLSYMAAMARMAGRRPFKTQNGYIGLGPSDLAVGDTLAIPYGAPVPFAFRPIAEGDEPNSFRLVGETYVFGIMDGEYMKVHRGETVLRIV